MNEQNDPYRAGEDREMRLAEAIRNLNEVESFLVAESGGFPAELFDKLESELLDAAEVFSEEGMEIKHNYALGLYEKLKQRKIYRSEGGATERQNEYHKKDQTNSRGGVQVQGGCDRS